jgi:hypothetical protein
MYRRQDPPGASTRPNASDGAASFRHRATSRPRADVTETVQLPPCAHRKTAGQVPDNHAAYPVNPSRRVIERPLRGADLCGYLRTDQVAHFIRSVAAPERRLRGADLCVHLRTVR